MTIERCLLCAVCAFAVASQPSRAADWPMWRCTPGRTAASAERLPRELAPVWTRRYDARVPVWDDRLNRDLMPYDRSFEPVVARGRMFIPFNDSDKLVCLDVDDGRELWRFYADGPVRLPPVAWRDSVLFCSDDGYLYCLDAATGRLRYRHAGAPRVRRVIGNERIISTWPARGGPVVADGRVYYAASIWPFMGTFVYALDVETGRVAWCNDSTSAQYIKQPHNSPAFAGVAPQGAFAFSGGRLFVPGGRSVPACFDAATGDQLYYRLAANGKTGGAFVAAEGDVFLNHHRDGYVSLYDAATGDAVARRIGRYPAVKGTTAYYAGETLAAVDLAALRRDPKNKGASVLWTLECDATGDVILAGDRLYAAGGTVISAVDLPTDGAPAAVAWRATAAAPVVRLLAASGKLFAVGADGSIAAYGRPGARHVLHDDRAREATARRGRARRLIERTGVSEGYALVCGTRDARFLEELARASTLRILALVPGGDLDGIRRRLDAGGLYGTRVAALAFERDALELPPYAFSLCAILPDASATSDERALAALYEAVRPYDGILWCESGSRASRTLARLAGRGRLEGAKHITTQAAVSVRRGGPLPGAADWTHQYGDAANTVKSNDLRVRLPLGLLWFGGSSHDDVLPRHGHGPPQQVVGGRLFIEGIDMFSARDVYTGRVLWRRKVGDLGTFGVYYDKTYKDTPTSTAYNQVHLAGANTRAANYVVTSDRVYVATATECLVLDPATGKTTGTFPLPSHGGDARDGWGLLVVSGSRVFGGSGLVQHSARLAEFVNKLNFAPAFDWYASRTLFAMDRISGDVLWKTDARHGYAHNGVVVSGDRVYCLDTVPPLVTSSGARQAEAGASRIAAVGAATGRVIWSTDDDVFGSWLGYSEEHDVLVHAGRPSRDMVAGEGVKRLAAYRGRDGARLWVASHSYGSPPMLHHDRIITEGAMYDLASGKRVSRPDPVTGQDVRWTFRRTYGCNYAIAGEHILTFRSAAAGFYDLTGDGGTGNFGGFKSSCTSNLIAADGVLNAPDYTRTCSCSYQNQTSLALAHDPDVEFWTAHVGAKPQGRIRRLGVNFGAPGDRRDGSGTLWLEYPVVGGPSPVEFVDVEMPDGGYYRMHSARVDGDGLRWVAASGMRGEAKVRIPLGGSDSGHWGVDLGVGAGADDAEEAEGGAVNLGSSDLEMVRESSRQTIGIRFAGVDLAPRTLVARAHVQFVVDETGGDATRLTIRAEASDDARAFSKGERNITSREATTASVVWEPRPWPEKGAAGSAQRTPDIAPLINEVIFRPGWRAGNAIALIISGTGKRVAVSHNGDGARAPRLRISKTLVRKGPKPVRCTVRLHFAEPDDIRTGERVFDVLLQGRSILRRLDLTRETGAARRTCVKVFRNVAASGAVDIELRRTRSGRGLPPVLSGVEVVVEGKSR